MGDRAIWRVVGLLCLALAALPAQGADWPQWRGPARDGVTPESSGWPQGWPPREAWRTNVGFGMSSPILVQGRVYALGWKEDGKDHVTCLDAATGKTLWEQSYASPAYVRQGATFKDTYKGPFATPALDTATGCLYTLSCDGELCCWDTAQGGARRWSVGVNDRYHLLPVKPEFHGFVPSPLLYGDWVIVEAGAQEGNLLAFDKRTGAFRWASAGKRAMGIGSPALVTVDGIPCAAAVTRDSFLVARMDDGHAGETLAEYPWPSWYAENSPSPVVSGSQVLLTMCESCGRQTALLTLGMALNGHLREEYRTKEFFTCTSTAALFQGHLYFRSGKRVRCIELASGKEKWSSPDLFVENHAMGAEVGTLLVAAGDGKLVIWDGQKGGDLVLADASPAGPYHELARIKGVLRDGLCYPQVAMAGGRILCRSTLGDLVCLSVAPRAPAPREWEDSFDGKALDPRWTWRAPVQGPAYSLAERPGWLRIRIPQRQEGYNQWNEPAADDAPQLRAPAPTGDWTLEARVQLQQFAPDSHFMAGVMVGFSDSRLLCWGPLQGPGLPGGPKEPEAWLEPTGQSGYAKAPGPAGDLLLRLAKAGTTYRASLRRPGGEWQDAGTYTCADPPQFVGIIGKTFSPGPGITFDVDSIRLGR